MTFLRTFIAVEIPTFIRQAILQKTELLRKTLDKSLVRWVPIQNVHLTLKFLGNVSPGHIDVLTRMLRTETDMIEAFAIHINSLGCFPSLRRPRVIFVGIQAAAELESLFHRIDSACVRLGYKSEQQRFSPHLTLGRIKPYISASDQQKIRRALEELKIDSLGTARVDSVHLYKSDLKSSSSIYTKIFSAPLKTWQHYV